MKRWTLILGALSVLMATGVRGGEFVTDWGGLLTAAGDVDGDGDWDAVMVEGETGLVSVGILNGNGTLAFRRPAAAGLPEVTGMALGRLLGATTDTLAVASAVGNRVQIMDLGQEDLRLRVPVFPLAGPRWLAALPIPGGVAGLDGLALAAAFDGVAPKLVRELVNGGSGVFTTVGAGSVISDVAVWNPVAVSRGGVQRLVLVETGVGTSTLRLVEPTGGSLSFVATVTGLAAGGRVAHGYFDAAEVDLFWFVPGSASVEARRLLPGGTAFSGGSGFAFPKPLVQLLRLPDAVADRMLAVYDDGKGEIWSYTAVGGFVSIQDVDVGGLAGGVRAALALGEGRLLTLSGGAGGVPTSYRLNEWDGSSYVLTQGGDLPRWDRPGTVAGGNVFYFANAPFLAESPKLLGVDSVGQWSSAFSLLPTPQASGEQVALEATGLRNPVVQALAPIPAGTAGGLVNQYAADISVVQWAEAALPFGDHVAKVEFAPKGGRHEGSVKAELSCEAVGASLFWRKPPATTFSTYAVPILFLESGVLEAYAELPDGRRSPVTRAVYTLENAPGEQDRDGDGVPDFVEIAEGLDAEGGPHSDGDGVSDLDELLAGTDPKDSGSKPASRDSRTPMLELTVTPRAMDPVTATLASAATGVMVTCRTVDGRTLGEGVTMEPPVLAPAAVVHAAPVGGDQRLLVVSTPPHFDMQTADADRRRGREMVRLLAVPEAVDEEVAFVYDAAAGVAAERTRWVAAAQAARVAARRAPEGLEITPEDTLVLVLTEVRLGHVLGFRGIGGSATPLSLTPYRPGEPGFPFMTQITPEVLIDVEGPAPFSPPAFSQAVRSREVLAEVEALVKTPVPTPGMAALKKLVNDLYRISAAYHNEAEGLYEPPLDVLRKFMEFGSLPTPYQAQTTVTALELGTAFNSLFSFRFGTPTRPLVTLMLKLPANQTAGETLALSLDESQVYSLWRRPGAVLQIPEAFQLAPGSAITVVAYDDLGQGQSPRPLEVLEVGLTGIPLPSASDEDGNLLPDAWERAFFGEVGIDPLLSPDGSGYSALHQFLAGSDPRLGDSVPDESAVEFVFREVEPEAGLPGEFAVEFHWPTLYLEAFEFVVLADDDLTDFELVPAAITHVGGGLHRAVISGVTGSRQFYRVGVRLR